MSIKDDLKEKGIISYPLDLLMGDRFGRYAKYIIQERALPDVRDGLKPVQRRILYAMNELKLTSDKPFKKSARIVGEVIGKYHPHGDTSVYEAIVRMSQAWKNGMPLIDMQGNNGSIDGDGPAAMRYTEIRLAKIADYLLMDLDEDTVEFAPNFDDSEKEPTVLPAFFPNILVNGASGIAAGYATNMPPHNLSEVINAAIALIKNPDMTLSQVMKYVKGPDFPTGGVLQGLDGVKDALKTGRGRVMINSAWHEEKGNIIIDEIPYEVIKQDMVKKIGEVAEKNPGLGIKEVRDETDREGLRISIDLQKGANLEVVRKYLFKNTPLSLSYNYNNVVIVDKQPKQLGIIPILQAYIAHYRDVYTRKSKYELKKTEDRLEILYGLIKALSILDEVVACIRKSNNRQDVIQNLMSEFKFTEPQATAIAEMKLYRLSSTDVQKLEAEKDDLEKFKTHLNEILKDSAKMDDEIISNLQAVEKEFGYKRKTKIEEEAEDLDVDIKETIVEKKFHLYVSKDGYMKNIDSAQIARNDPEKFGRKPNDIWIASEEVSNLDTLILTTSSGTYYLIPLFKLPSSRWTDIGTHVNDFAPMSGDESIVSAIVVSDWEKANEQLLVATKQGSIKRVAIKDLETKTFSKSFRLMKLDKTGDAVIAAQLVTSKTRNVAIMTEEGYGVRYDIDDIPLLSTNAKGVKSTTAKDNVMGAVALESDEQVLFITDKDRAKKLNQDEIPLFVRPKKGNRLFPSPKYGKELIKFGFSINNDSNISIVNDEDIIKVVNPNRLKDSTTSEVTSPLGIKDIVSASLETAYMVDPNDNMSGSSSNKDNEPKPIKTESAPKLKKADDKITVKDASKEDEIKKRLDSLSSNSSFLDELDELDLTSKKKKPDNNDDDDDVQLSFNDLLDDDDK